MGVGLVKIDINYITLLSLSGQDIGQFRQSPHLIVKIATIRS